jgi:RND family efflux transporter MFP subunit
VRSRERALLAGGIAVGLAIAGALYAFREPVGTFYARLRGQAAAQQQTEQLSQRIVTPQEESAAQSVQLTSEEQKSIGVETVEVQRRSIRREITVPGKVAEPESGIGTISTRIGGRIEKLFSNVTGQTVSRGQAVASIYSPELFASVEEYKLALDNRRRLSASQEAKALAQADELVDASRRRLERWGLTAEQIDAIPTATAPALETTIYSSIAGVITQRHVTEGQYVKEGDTLFTVTDLGTVWVQADIFESDIPAVRSGTEARISSPALQGANLRGTIDFLQPSVDPQTRTMTARIQVPNLGMRLRPGMFVQISFSASLASDTIAVPRDAVLNTGREQVVYVATENGIFEKRSIQAEAVGEDFYSVTKGLQPGERVVTRGNFLIDSQTRLTGTITGMFGGSKAYGSEAQSSQNYTVALRSEPSPPKGGSDGRFYVTVAGPDGKPVMDAQVQITLVMPAMPSMGMAEMRSSFNLSWNGSEYTGSGPVAMAGPWNVTVEASRNGQLLGVYRSRFDAK